LHFSNLPFSHKAHHEKRGDENDRRSNKDKSHNKRLAKNEKTMRKRLLFLKNKRIINTRNLE
jgi:hypothetical protein